MEPFVKLNGLVAPLDQNNVDTDAIIPKQFLKRIERSGFGQYVFFELRFDDDGNLKPDFEMNKPRYQGASILVSRANFGCAPPASTPPGPCSTTASAPSSPPATPTFSTTTASITASCRSASAPSKSMRSSSASLPSPATRSKSTSPPRP
jgi:hypothetical protein